MRDAGCGTQPEERRRGDGCSARYTPTSEYTSGLSCECPGLAASMLSLRTTPPHALTVLYLLHGNGQGQSRVAVAVAASPDSRAAQPHPQSSAAAVGPRRWMKDRGRWAGWTSRVASGEQRGRADADAVPTASVDGDSGAAGGTSTASGAVGSRYRVRL